MKRLLFILILVLCLSGCTAQESVDIVATTRPVYDFAAFLCQGTDLRIGQLITENVSCLHDYSLSVSQVKMLESSDHVVVSGAGLESFMEDVLSDCNNVIDASLNISPLDCSEDHGHEHEADAHIWLAPKNAKQMAQNICDGLCASYPEHAETFRENYKALAEKIDALDNYASEALAVLSCRELITFHDGFAYMAHDFELTIAAAMEEESGSEASAKELIELIKLVETKNIPAIFVEANGSVSAAGIIAKETNVSVYTLDMGMSGDYFETMKHNIDTLKEALG